MLATIKEGMDLDVDVDGGEVEEGELTSSSEDDGVVPQSEALKPLDIPLHKEPPMMPKTGTGSAPLVNFMAGEPALVPLFDDDFDYVVLERPKLAGRGGPGPGGPNASTSTTTAASSSMVFGQVGGQFQEPPESHRQEQQATTITGTGTIGALIDDDLYDKDFKSSSSDSSDSDSDGGGVYKRHRMDVFNDYRGDGKNGHKKRPPPQVQAPAGGQSSSTSSMSSAFNQMAGQFQKQRKVNNIWSDVLLEDKVSESFGIISVEPGCLADRGSESYFRYNPHKAKHNPRKRRANAKGGGGEGVAVSDEATTTGTDDPGYISDSGISEYSYNILEKNELEAKKDPSYEKTKGERNVYWRNFENEVKAFKPKQLSNFIIRRLNEPKGHLIKRSIALLGREMAIKLFMKTLKIQDKGGIYVVNRQRKRTIGGIYLYLLRGYPGLESEVVDKIFESEDQATANRNRDKAKARKKKYKAINQVVKNAQTIADSDDVENPAEAEIMQDQDNDNVQEPSGLAEVKMEESID